MKNVLALDYGTKWVGVAVTAGELSQPLITLTNNEQLFSHLKEIVNRHQIKLIVVGGSEGEMLRITQNFAQDLSNFLHVPVKIIDETMSSKEAQSSVFWLKGKLKRRRPLHHLAAAIILDTYLDCFG